LTRYLVHGSPSLSLSLLTEIVPIMARLLLMALVFNSFAIQLALGNFDDCSKVVEKQPATGPLIKQFNGKDVTIGGVLVGDLKCLGGGDHSLAFLGMHNGAEVIVRMIHTKAQIKRRTIHDDMRKKFFHRLEENPGAIGTKSFVPQISEGFTTEMPQVYAEVWSKAIGQNMKEIQDNGGFKSPEDFYDFAKHSCEAIIFMWGVGMQHGDVQRGNLMWDEGTRSVSMIDYEAFDEMDPGERNNDIDDLYTMFRKYGKHHAIEEYGDKAVAMVEDLREHHKEYAKSLDKFVKFYERHFNDKMVLPHAPDDGE